MNGKAKGTVKELDSARQFEAEGATVVRSAGSHGAGDLVVGWPDGSTWLVQVKATRRGPFSDFPPAERAELERVARRCRWVPVLAHWPHGHGPARGHVIYEPDKWPVPRAA